GAAARTLRDAYRDPAPVLDQHLDPMLCMDAAAADDGRCQRTARQLAACVCRTAAARLQSDGGYHRHGALPRADQHPRAFQRHESDRPAPAAGGQGAWRQSAARLRHRFCAAQHARRARLRNADLRHFSRIFRDARTARRPPRDHGRHACQHVFFGRPQLGLRLGARHRTACFLPDRAIPLFRLPAQGNACGGQMKRHIDLFTVTAWVPWAFAGLVLLFLAAPLIVVIPAAFNASSLLQFPPREWSLRWFHEYFSGASWIAATKTSFKVALVVSVVSTLLGLTTSVLLTRFTFFGRN